MARRNAGGTVDTGEQQAQREQQAQQEQQAQAPGTVVEESWEPSHGEIVDSAPADEDLHPEHHLVDDEHGLEPGSEAGAGQPAPRRRSHGSRRARRARRARRPAPTRRSRRRRAERRRFWLVTMPALIAVTALTVLVGRAVRDDGGGASTSARGAGRGQTATTSAVLLAHRAADGRSDLLALVGSDGERVNVLLLPTATQAEVPSLGIQTLGDVTRLGDTTLLETTVENILGVRLAPVTVLDDAALDALLGPAAPFSVDLRAPVRFAGDEDPTFRDGSQDLAAVDARRILTQRQEGSELDRLVPVQAVLEGWFAKLRERGPGGAVAARSPVGAALVRYARLGGAHFDTLPVRTLASGLDERYEVRRDELADAIAESFPHARLGDGRPRPRVEILNGTGAVGVAQTIAAKVVPAGGEVTLTGNVPGFGVVGTQVVYYRDGDRAAAQRLLDALGTGALKRERRALGIVDVTIVVGADLAPVGS